MAELIDQLLVISIVGSAVFLTIRHLRGIMIPPTTRGHISCAGCDQKCEVRELAQIAIPRADNKISG